jgi:hypothetical protein
VVSTFRALFFGRFHLFRCFVFVADGVIGDAENGKAPQVWGSWGGSLVSRAARVLGWWWDGNALPQRAFGERRHGVDGWWGAERYPAGGGGESGVSRAEREPREGGLADYGLAGWHERRHASGSEPCMRTGAWAATPEGTCDCTVMRSVGDMEGPAGGRPHGGGGHSALRRARHMDTKAAARVTGRWDVSAVRSVERHDLGRGA